MKAQHEGVEMQREQFHFEIEGLKERILDLEREKTKKRKVSGQQSTNKMPTVELAASLGSNSPREKSPWEDRRGSQESQSTVPDEANTSSPNQPEASQPRTLRKSNAQIVKGNPTRSSSEKPWTEVKYSYKKGGMAKKKTQRQEPGGRRILFPREEAKPKMSEEDIMLALDEAFQRVGEPTSVHFSRVSYSHSGAISALLGKKGDAIELLRTRTHLLIRAVKTVDRAVIGDEALEHWQRLKVHGMPLSRYLGEEKMELLR